MIIFHYSLCFWIHGQGQLFILQQKMRKITMCLSLTSLYCASSSTQHHTTAMLFTSNHDRIRNELWHGYYATARITTWRKGRSFFQIHVTTVSVWVHLAFKPYDEKEPNHMEETICKIYHNKMLFKSATNLKQRLQMHHPQHYHFLMFKKWINCSYSLRCMVQHSVYC